MAGVITIGSDYSAIIRGVKNAVSGAALTGATVTAQLYTSAGVVVGTSVSCSYVSASAGTAADAEFAGTIESTVTSTLTAGSSYYILYTVSSSGIDSVHREDLTAQSPGSTLIDPVIWSAFSGTSLTAGSADELSVAMACSAVSAAIERKLRPYLPMPRTITAYLDAPMDNLLILPFRPVRSITSISLRWGASGDSSLFTSDYLLTDYTDYYSPLDPFDGVNRAGVVYRRGHSIWAYETRYSLGKLAPAVDPNRGAIKIVAAVGEASVPADVRAACVAAVSLMYERRAKGLPLQSESFGGYSYSAASAFTAEAAIASPDVMNLLRPYLPVHVG